MELYGNQRSCCAPQIAALLNPASILALLPGSLSASASGATDGKGEGLCQPMTVAGSAAMPFTNVVPCPRGPTHSPRVAHTVINLLADIPELLAARLKEDNEAALQQFACFLDPDPPICQVGTPPRTYQYTLTVCCNS
jgi:hypothetical protein